MFFKVFVSEGVRFLGLLILILVYLGGVLGQHCATDIFAHCTFWAQNNTKNDLTLALILLICGLSLNILGQSLDDFWATSGGQIGAKTGP